MPAPEAQKWPRDLDGEMPLRDAARTIVERRLERLPALLAEVRVYDDRDPEPVHQLRVTTRRADAAMVAFRSSFKAGPWRRLRTMLKRVRRAAAAARACDVDIMLIATERITADAADHAALDHALDETRHERMTAQSDLERAADRYPRKKMKKRIRKLLRSNSAPQPGAAESTYADAARVALPTFIHRVREAGDADLQQLEHLHELRIRGKSLRYAMELFASSFDSVYRERLYPQIKSLQEQLGKINDEHEIAERYDRLAIACGSVAISEGLRRLADYARSRRDIGQHAFIAHWTALRERGVLTALERYVEDGSSSQG